MNWWNELDFLHANASSGKLKIISMILGWACQKWAWPFSSGDPKSAV